MFITLAYPYEDHEPDETIEVDPAVGRSLIHDGLARNADVSTLDGLTLPELQEHARDNGIDLGSATRKAAVIKAIQAAEKTSAPSPITPVDGAPTKEAADER